MKKIGYVIAALATIAIVAPSLASADTVVVKHGDHHGWHPHHHDKVVVIKHHRHD